MNNEFELCFNLGKVNFDDAMMIRQLVFVEEQGFVNEFDDIDEIAHHLVIYKNKKPIAVGRMYQENEDIMILGRIATLKEYRGKHIGSLIVKSLEIKAKELGYQITKLSAQQRASNFYEKLGYHVIGDVYFDEWCPHITMVKNL